jgi:FkbM family methyltransferase
MSAVSLFRAEDTGSKPASDQNTPGIIREIEYRHGRIRYLSTDYGVGRNLELYGEYFEGEVALMRRLIHPGDVVVSAGGNIGAHLIPLSRMAGSVITFEPQVFLREQLLQPNLDMNGCTNVTVRPEALGEAHGSASLPTIDYAIPNNFGGMELREQGPCPVPVVPLDSLDLASCAFLMLDIEGFELPALKGARETIKRCRPYLYVEIDRDDRREEVLAYMVEVLGYEVLFHTPPVFRADNYAGETRNYFGSIRSIMCLGIPS